MDWATASVAIAASFASAAVAIYTIRRHGTLAREDRDHDRTMAREARRQERRGAAYIELLTALHQLMTRIERISPVLQTPADPEPPPPLSDPTLWRLNALTDAHGSRELQDMIRAWTSKQNDFYLAVDWLRQVKAYGENRPPSETRAAYGVTSTEQWKKIIAIRTELMEDLKAIGERVQEELEERIGD